MDWSRRSAAFPSPANRTWRHTDRCRTDPHSCVQTIKSSKQNVNVNVLPLPTRQRWSASAKPSARHQFTLWDHRYGAGLWAPFSVYASPIAGTHCAYPRRDGQAELAWVAGHIPGWFTCPPTVTDPSGDQGPNLQNFANWTFVILSQFFRMSFVCQIISYRMKRLRKNCEKRKNIR